MLLFMGSLVCKSFVVDVCYMQKVQLYIFYNLWLHYGYKYLFSLKKIYIYTVEITNVVWSRTLWNCVLPKHVAEAPLMFILIKDVHLFGIINYVRRTHTCLRPTDKFASVQRRARTHTHIYICVCVCPNYQYVSSTAHTLLFVRPTHQYASVQLHIYMCMSSIPVCKFNCTYTPMCTSNTPVCVSSSEHICVRPIYRYVLGQLQTVKNL